MGSTFFGLLSLLALIPGVCAGLDWKHEFNGHQYAIIEKTVGWHEASDKCMGEGGYLTSIESREESDFVEEKVASQSNEYWIGINDLDKDKEWVWTDEKKLGFKAWDSKEPQSYEDCGYLSSGLWSSSNCGETKPFICKRKKGDTSPKSTVPPPLVPGDCPSGWVDAGTNRCYKIHVSKTTLTWAQARDKCRSTTDYTTDFACATEKKESDTLTRMVGERPIEEGLLLGIYRSNTSTIWADNSRLKLTNFHRSIKPGDRGCGFISHGLIPAGSWGLQGPDCYAKYKAYICQVLKKEGNKSTKVTTTNTTPKATTAPTISSTTTKIATTEKATTSTKASNKTTPKMSTTQVEVTTKTTTTIPTTTTTPKTTSTGPQKTTTKIKTTESKTTTSPKVTVTRPSTTTTAPTTTTTAPTTTNPSPKSTSSPRSTILSRSYTWTVGTTQHANTSSEESTARLEWTTIRENTTSTATQDPNSASLPSTHINIIFSVLFITLYNVSPF